MSKVVQAIKAVLLTFGQFEQSVEEFDWRYPQEQEETLLVK